MKQPEVKSMATQQEFLREAMVELGLKREGFAMRLSCPKRTLDKWLLQDTSNDHRTMDNAMWHFVREVLEHERLKASLKRGKKRVLKTPLKNPIGDIH
jgi:hypothetical protein